MSYGAHKHCEFGQGEKKRQIHGRKHTTTNTSFLLFFISGCIAGSLLTFSTKHKTGVC